MKKSFKEFLSLIFLFFCGYIFLYPNIAKAGKVFQKSLNVQQKAKVQFDNNITAFHLPTFDLETAFENIISIEFEEENDELTVHQKAIHLASFFQHFYNQLAALSAFILANPFAKNNQLDTCTTQKYIFFQHFRV